MNFFLSLFLKYLVTVGVVAAMAEFLPQYIMMTRSWQAFALIGAVIFGLNLLARPVLNLLTLPLRLFISILALLIVNGVIVWLLVQVMDLIDPSIAEFEIIGGWTGWIVVVVVLGLANWLMKKLLR